jgi:hypothetical protein
MKTKAGFAIVKHGSPKPPLSGMSAPRNVRHVLVAIDMCSEVPAVRGGNFSGETGLTFLHRFSNGQQADFE